MPSDRLPLALRRRCSEHPSLAVVLGDARRASLFKQLYRSVVDITCPSPRALPRTWRPWLTASFSWPPGLLAGCGCARLTQVPSPPSGHLLASVRQISGFPPSHARVPVCPAASGARIPPPSGLPAAHWRTARPAAVCCVRSPLLPRRRLLAPPRPQWQGRGRCAPRVWSGLRQPICTVSR